MTLSPPQSAMRAAPEARQAGVSGGFTALDGERYAVIANVDEMAPFLMSVASDSDFWLYVGSNGPFTAGRGSPDGALFPYQTVDKVLRHPDASGARTIFLVERDGNTVPWEPWQDIPVGQRVTRNVYKRVDGGAVIFEEVNHQLGLRFRSRLTACASFGLVRHAEVADVAGAQVHVRYLDGWHEVLPPGVGQDTYARLSYLAAAYMHHERLPDVPLAIFALNAAISDRPEPSESLRVAAAWSVGHHNPTILLSDRQVGTFRRGGAPQPETEIRGEMGAFLVADEVHLEAGGRHDWYTVGDTLLDHVAIDDLRRLLAEPDQAMAQLEAAGVADRVGLRDRVAAADGLQLSADEGTTASHLSSVLFNIMRGGTFTDGYRVPLSDLASYLYEQNRSVCQRHEAWVAQLPAHITIRELWRAAEQVGDPQLVRLVRAYLPLTYSRRHGDPSRPWNWFTIRVRDDAGRPIFGYQGNWRDIFQNWDALGAAFPEYLPAFIGVFLNATTADGYNPYRISRTGIDWEVEDPRDPWAHIGYWGDHQIVYLERLLEALQQHDPAFIAGSLAERCYAYANVPYRIAGLRALIANPRSTIEFDHLLHLELAAAARELGADGKLLRDSAGNVRLVTLLEKLLVPLLAKLTNLVPGGGIWLNTQRPEWNDANNALAGWGLSIVTLGAISRYLSLLAGLVEGDANVPVSAAVAGLMESVTQVLATAAGPLDDSARYRIMVELGTAGEAYRKSVYDGELGADILVSTSTVRALAAAASPVVGESLRASRRPDGLYHSYNMLRIEGERAIVDHLGPMLEGQVALLDSELLSDHEAVSLLRALRASEMYRADLNTYMLYPDRALTPYLERNTLAGDPPITDPALFVRDASGRWHFQADLSTMTDIDERLEASRASAETSAAVRALWRATFGHDEFTGRSGRFFMFEGLGSVYWHMNAKLLLAVQGCHRRATDPQAAAALAQIHDEIREGMGFRMKPDKFGAFPTDPHSHSPRDRGAQQPGMTGLAKEQVLARLGELGIEVAQRRLRFRPRLLHRAEFMTGESQFEYVDVAGDLARMDLPARSLAFTYCQVPVCYTAGDAAVIKLERQDGSLETVSGDQLSVDASAAIFGRLGTYRRVWVTVRSTDLLADRQPNAT